MNVWKVFARSMKNIWNDRIQTHHQLRMTSVSCSILWINLLTFPALCTKRALILTPHTTKIGSRRKYMYCWDVKLLVHSEWWMVCHDLCPQSFDHSVNFSFVALLHWWPISVHKTPSMHFTELSTFHCILPEWIIGSVVKRVETFSVTSFCTLWDSNWNNLPNGLCDLFVISLYISGICLFWKE